MPENADTGDTKVSKMEGCSRHYNVTIGGRLVGFVSGGHRTYAGEWRAYWYAQPRNLNLGDFPTRREAVAELHIKAVGEGIVPVRLSSATERSFPHQNDGT